MIKARATAVTIETVKVSRGAAQVRIALFGETPLISIGEAEDVVKSMLSELKEDPELKDIVVEVK